MKRETITYSVINADGSKRTGVVRGQTARTLQALVQAGPVGCTAHEVSSWALRFAAYAHDLRHKHDLAIETLREEHPGGWHGRHRLLTPVTIEEVTQ